MYNKSGSIHETYLGRQLRQEIVEAKGTTTQLCFPYISFSKEINSKNWALRNPIKANKCEPLEEKIIRIIKRKEIKKIKRKTNYEEEQR